MASLYVVGTPIGNLKDITLRALEILSDVQVIACEDTRHSLKLLTAHGIKKRLISCHGQNEEESAKGIIQLLEKGQDVAFISDAGTPGISDPGAVLVRAVRSAGFPVIPVPGVSALATLASVSGAGGRTLVFDGFLSPRAGKRRKRVQELMERGENFVLYESPHRIVKLLDNIADIDNGRIVFVGRELTKFHEECVAGPAGDLAEKFRTRNGIKGEFAVFVHGL